MKKTPRDLVTRLYGEIDKGLKQPETHAKLNSNLDHPYIGCDKGDGSDVSGGVKRLLRERFRTSRR